LLLSRDVNNPRRCYVNKDGGGVNDLPLNLTFICYFETFVIVTWWKQPQATRC